MTENDRGERTIPSPGAKSPAARWQSGAAMWFFVGATFLFAWSAMLPADANAALRVVMIVLGFVALVGGIVEWVRAQRAADAKAAPDGVEPPPPSPMI